eukprot:CAMPEP_0170632900 /NCGR_PEP_ID=MMETSP0224-20130122/35623_1 /TAXON_ID=285029 /ORGANISM="Togula jolla, Strain CCCM 725" /LENGTH=38 /DNA_ID= /DNA_START= /DNA_END= /DNA_ORIENTATION=
MLADTEGSAQAESLGKQVHLDKETEDFFRELDECAALD